MVQLRALLPLCALCCLLVAIADVAAERHRNWRGHHEELSLSPHRRFLSRWSPSHHSHHHRRRYRLRVRTACHGQTLHIGCHGGYQVLILNAFYGRASNRICSKLHFRHGHRLHSHHTACSAHDSLARARQLCHGKQQCRLAAKSSVFGKPCKSKARAYLRVRYACVFRACRRVVWLQAKLVELIGRFDRLAKRSYGYWRRRHFRHRRYRLKRKLNRLRTRFHFCFKCKRGCKKIRKLLSRLELAEKRIREMLDKLSAKQHKKAKKAHGHKSWRLRAARVFLKRKLGYLRARQYVLRRKLRRCKRSCRY